jgi:putative membrane protein
MILPPDSADRIAAAIEVAEGHTSAELVVVGVPFSGRYRDVEYLIGGVSGLAFLAWALFSDHHVPELAVIPSVALVAAVGAVVARFSPQLRRLLSSHARRVRQAETAAEVAFLQNGVDTTRARTGVLVHVSFLEQHVTLVADRGVQSTFSTPELEAERQALEAALRSPDPVGGLCQALEHLGATLGERLPREEDDEDELSNVPLLGVHG